LIELENLNRDGKGVLTSNHHTFSKASPNPNPGSKGEGTTLGGSRMENASRSSLFSKENNNNSRLQSRDYIPGAFSTATSGMGDTLKSSDGFRNPERRGAKRMIDPKDLQTS
jgi:hypothetical protein